MAIGTSTPRRGANSLLVTFELRGDKTCAVFVPLLYCILGIQADLAI